MKSRLRIITFGLLVSGLVMVTLLFWLESAWRDSMNGAWTSTTPYRGTTPGSVSLIITEDNRVRVTAAPGNSLWWTASEYELHLREDVIEVRSGQELIGELFLKQTRSELRLKDRRWPTEALRLRRADHR